MLFLFCKSPPCQRGVSAKQTGGFFFSVKLKVENAGRDSLPRGEGVSRRLTEEGFTGIPEGSLPCAKGGGISAGNDGGIVILSNKKTGGYYPPLHFQLSTINFQFEKNPPVTFGASPL